MYKKASRNMDYLDKTGAHSDRIERGGNQLSDQTFIFRIDDDFDLAALEQAKKELSLIMLALSEDINNIRDQLCAAKAKRITEKVWADPDWFRRATSALKHKGRQHQSYQTSMGEINRRIRQWHKKLSDWDENRQFITMARKILPRDQYDMIWTMVRAELADKTH